MTYLLIVLSVADLRAMPSHTIMTEAQCRAAVAAYAGKPQRWIATCYGPKGDVIAKNY